MVCDVYDLGLIDYQRAWDLQGRLASEIATGARCPALLLLEHPHTYTFGRRADTANLLWDAAQLAERRVSVFNVDRGGEVTYHGPGQLVGYPLIPLGALGGNERLPEADHVGYVRKLEKALIIALARLGVSAGQVKGMTGVWVQPDVYSRCTRCRPEDRAKPAKIAAIGVKVDGNGISRHGFALNIAPDMSYWEGIIPCGISDHPVTCLADLVEILPPMEAIVDAITSAFGEVFGYQMQKVNGEEILSNGV